MRGPMSLLLATALAVSGCISPARIHPDELIRLDGFEGDDAVALRSQDGRAVAFTRETQLGLVLRGGDEIANHYGRVEVIEGVFYGAIDGTGAQVAVALEDVEYARVWQEGSEERGTVGLMILTMWLMLGVVVGIGWAIYEYGDFDDTHVDIFIISY